MPNEVPVAFHNGSNYDYHFIIKELTNEFERQFNFLSYLFSPINFLFSPVCLFHNLKCKDGNESVETISYKIKFMDSMRFMETSLSKVVDDLTEEIHKIRC